MFNIRPNYQKGESSNIHAVDNADTSQGYTKDGRFLNLDKYEFEAIIIRQITRHPDIDDEALNVEIIRRLTWYDDESQSLMNHIMGKQLHCFGTKAHHTTVLSFVTYLFKNKIMSSCGVQGLNQTIELSDWIITETQRLANVIPRENWKGASTPYKIITRIIGANNYWGYDNYQTTRDDARSRTTSYVSEMEDLNEVRHKLLDIMALTEERFRKTIKNRNESGALGAIKKGDQDHYIFDGGHQGASPKA